MRAHKWRTALLGDVKLIQKLRESIVDRPLTIRDQSDMEADLRRTFPRDTWFNTHEHLGNLTTIIMTYAHTNPSVGYAQGMCFITFLLYRVYYHDCPTHAISDTLYSLHGLMRHIRPMFPRDSHDTQVVIFIDAATNIIRLKFLYNYPQLTHKLRNKDYVKLMFIKCGPALFANWFEMEDTKIIWDYIFDGDIFDNILTVVGAMILHHKEIYLQLCDEKILELTSIKSFYKVSSIVSYARTLKR